MLDGPVAAYLLPGNRLTLSAGRSGEHEAVTGDKVRSGLAGRG